MSDFTPVVDANRQITQLSVSQVTNADHKQEGGCLRRWWFEVPNGLKPEQTYERNEGTAGHELLRRYLLTGERPQGRVLMGKAVTGVILKGELPPPGEHLHVERRFSGQAMRDYERCECGHLASAHEKKGCRHLSAGLGTLDCDCKDFRPAWVPLERSLAFRLGGVVWDGAIDLWFRNENGRLSIWDHKFSSDPDLYAKKNSELIKTVQMPVYAFAVEPGAPTVELVHHYVSKRGVYSFTRRYVATRDEITERLADITQVVERMKQAALAKDQGDVPANTRSCDAWNGCPHQSICSAFKQRNTHPKERTVALSQEEQDIFGAIDGAITDTAASTPASTAPAEVEQSEDAEDAALKAQLEAAQKALAEKQAKRKMKIVDVPAEGESKPAAPPPPPVPKAEQPWSVTCACGATVNAENGSRLQSGEVKHIGCPKDAAPPAPAQPKSAKKAKSEPPPMPKPETSQPAPSKPTPPPPAAPAFRGESETDRAARAAADAVAEQKREKEQKAKTTGPVELVDDPLRLAAAEFLRSRFKGEVRTDGRETSEIVALINAANDLLRNAA